MADMNPGIILAGRSPDIWGSYATGLQTAFGEQAGQRQNALAALYQTQGPQIMAGEPQALNALARQDPMAAMGVQQTQQEMGYSAERMQIARRGAEMVAQQAAREAEAWAMDKSAADLAAAQAEAEAAMAQIVMPYAMDIARGLQGDQAAWARVADAARQAGMTPEQFTAQAFAVDSAATVLKGIGDVLPEAQGPKMGALPQGYMLNDPNNPQAGMSQIPGAPPPTSGITINTGENSSAFGKKSDELAAERFSGIVSDGQNAQRMVGDLATLAEIAKGLETGVPAQVLAALGPYADALGLPVEGLGPAQAYDSIVARMAPQMRTPGAGASSDFDAKQFLKSLPALGKTPEGNAIISATLNAIAQHKIAAAEIAGKAQRGEITWQEADAQMARLGNPFDAFNKYKGMGGKPGLSQDDLDFMNGVSP